MSSFKKYIAAISVIIVMVGCTKSDFESAYTDPAKIATTTVSRQFAGMLYSNVTDVVPDYYVYFSTLRTTINQYTQALGTINTSNQYAPGSVPGGRIYTYYNFLAQYREFQDIYGALNQADQDSNRIYMIAATTYFYDHTQIMVDLFGDIPWSTAGMLHRYGGDYVRATPTFDDAATIYTTMLDSLKNFSNELSTLQVNAAILSGFKTQDIINNGNVELWRKYCNSLRLRMLTRVSAVPAFASRAASEIKSIIDNPTAYPVVTSNADNIQIDVYDPNSAIRVSIQDAFEAGGSFYANLASKSMIDLLNQTADPRERVLFEPGTGASGLYIGLDPTLNSNDQTSQVVAGKIAIWNRSTISRNKYLPGTLMNAAEVQFLMAEAFLKNNNIADAQTAYENGIKASIENMYRVRAVSQNNDAGTVTPYTPLEVNNYIANPLVNWSNATTTEQKMQLIATQKWLHLNLLEPFENWAELRRLDKPVLSFFVDNSSSQTQPPTKWQYPDSKAPNTGNKIFWDVQ